MGAAGIKLEHASRWRGASLWRIASQNFAPAWSVRLNQAVGGSADRIGVIDRRPPEEKKFRFQDFFKGSQRSFLADSNTTPDRITVLRGRLNASARQVPTNPVVVEKFDILEDLSGSAPSGVTVVGTTPIRGDSRDGYDHMECTLRASCANHEYTAGAQVAYLPEAFDGPQSKSMAGATRLCVDEVINSWIAQALARR